MRSGLGLAPIVVREIYARLPAVRAEGTAMGVLVPRAEDVVQALAAASARLLSTGRTRGGFPARRKI